MSETICHYFLNAKNRQNKVAVEYVKSKKWVTLSWQNYFQNVETVACGLKTLGIEAGDRVVIFSNTRLEWALADVAILGLGAVTVPLYQSSIPEDIAFILKDSDAKAVIFESQDVYNRFKKIESDVQEIKIKIGINFSNQDVLSWQDLLDQGKSYHAKHPNFFEQSSLNTRTEDLATIVYTSGTTGTPKGVCLHHEQIMSEISEIFENIEVNDTDKTLSFLPFAHIFGRVEHWAHIYKGFTMAYAESIERIGSNLITVKPTFILAVPRIFEKIYNSIQTQAEGSPIKSKIFKWALGVGYEMSQYKVQKKIPPIKLLLEYQGAKRLVFDKLLKKMGGRLRFAVSGGAPLSGEIGKFFHAAGLLILEGYGLTETTAAFFVNTPYAYKFGTVGKAIGDVKIKIASDGEILVKSKKVMRSYLNNPEATQEVFDEEGYFRTGDIGELDAEGFLKITDRKKDLIKTAGGKYVAPQKLENLLKLNSIVSNVLIHGDKKKYIVALITLNVEAVNNFAKDNQMPSTSFEELSKNPRIKDLVRDVIAKVNSQLASYETIKNFAILANDFTIEGGELTPSLKVKRKYCDKKFDTEIRSLYGDSDDCAKPQDLNT